MRYKGIICLILGIGGSIVSCNDDWDEHYSRNGSIPEVSLMDMILNDSQLAKFSQILMKTGADSLLTSTQTYTVWAPVDEALSSVDMDDEAALQRKESYSPLFQFDCNRSREVHIHVGWESHVV